jgi:hypothetical protein
MNGRAILRGEEANHGHHQAHARRNRRAHRALRPAYHVDHEGRDRVLLAAKDIIFARKTPVVLGRPAPFGNLAPCWRRGHDDVHLACRPARAGAARQ